MGQNIGLVYMGFGDKRICTGLKWHQSLVGNAETDVLHGGVVTAMIDETAGAHRCWQPSINSLSPRLICGSIICALPRHAKTSIARRMLSPDRAYRFFNAQAFNDDPAKPIAVGTGTFMLGANARCPIFSAALSRRKKMGDLD